MTLKNKKKVQYFPSPLICMNKAPRLVNRIWRCYLRLQPHCDDDDEMTIVMIVTIMMMMMMILIFIEYFYIQGVHAAR